MMRGPGLGEQKHLTALLKAQSQWCATKLNLAQLLKNPQRFQRLSLSAPHVLVDFSKNLWDEVTLDALLNLAQSKGVIEHRDAMYAGEVVNVTEQRAALHVHLRAPYTSQSRDDDSAPAVESITACGVGLRAMLALAQEIRANPQIHDVVHIGIGGSSLGPEMALQALHPWCVGGPRVHVVSNMDGHDLQQVLCDLKPEQTLFVIASKSWSTAETQRNMASAQAWLCGASQLDWPDHFVAITSREDLAQSAGFTQTLHLPEEVGGRFSLWSAVGLPVAVAVGSAVFEQMLEGAAEMDAHFLQAPMQSNVPVWLGLLDVWYSTFMEMPGRCVVPYHHGLRRLPAYLQQLEMESNGKQVKANGEAVDYRTCGMVWGEPGSNGQHAFFQWLHQGTQRTPVEFILARTAAHGLPEHQEALIANALAQSQALMSGAKAQGGQLAGHQDFSGNRPSTCMVLDALTPQSFGALLALYEHRAFVAGVVWGVNSFDQWGVELGKTLAKDLRQRMEFADLDGLDASTAGLLSFCLQKPQ